MFPLKDEPLCAPVEAPVESAIMLTDAPAIVAPVDRDAEISALLSQSRAAHDRKKKAAGLTDKTGAITRHPNYPQAEAEMREALRLRLQAHDLDPDHASPAWHADQIANKGLSHQEMVAWCRTYQEIP